MKTWTRDELILALELYKRGGNLNKTDADVIKLSEEIGRTPDSVSMRLANYLALDPDAPQKGLTDGSHGLCRRVWNEFNVNPTRLRTSVSVIRRRNRSG